MGYFQGIIGTCVPEKGSAGPRLLFERKEPSALLIFCIGLSSRVLTFFWQNSREYDKSDAEITISCFTILTVSDHSGKIAEISTMYNILMGNSEDLLENVGDLS